MTSSTSLLVLLSLVTSSLSQEDCGDDCIGVYDPVCGEDGVTYPNSCVASCFHAMIICDEECPCDEPCGNGCPEYYQPVCGDDGHVYDNVCFANCNGAIVSCEGTVCPCQVTLSRPKNCGTRKKVARQPLLQDCVCTDEFNPVCGLDGMDYGNPCEAGCAGTGVQCYGDCPCPVGPPNGLHFLLLGLVSLILLYYLPMPSLSNPAGLQLRRDLLPRLRL